MTISGVAFDAFGTLFDLSALRGRAEEIVGPRGGELYDACIERLIPSTWHASAAGHHRRFPEVARLALEAAAGERGLDLDSAQAERIAAGLASLPAFPDAEAALENLRHLRLAVLSNGTPDGIKSLVEGAGLAGRFEHLLTADAVGRFKPAPEVYALAPQAFDATPESVVLVSGNEWDVAGARLAGLRGAWVSRGRPATGFLGIHADVTAEELSGLPEALRPLEAG
jgi:2-haloacid dehalogenase